MTDNKQKGFGILSDNLDTVRENIFGSSTQVREDLLQNYVLEEDPILVPNYDKVEDDPYVAPQDEPEDLETEKKKSKSISFSDILKGAWDNFTQLPTTQKVAETAKGITNTTSDIISGVEKHLVGMAQGDMALNNAKLDDLRFQKQFLENNIRRRVLYEQLNNAYLSQDTERVRALYPEYRNAFDKYISEEDQYKKIASKYYKQAGYQKTSQERIKAIDSMIKEIESENKELSDDLQRARQLIYDHNQIYRPDPEWEKNKQNNWVYQIPEGLGTSVTSLGAGIASGAATWAARAGALYLANSYMLSGGPYGAIANGAAAAIGATATVASTIWSRDQESRSEVAGAYNQFVQDWAQKNKISIDSLAEAGRQKLREKLGDNTAYSSDPNDSKYRDNQAVFEDMLAYNIPFDNEELDKIRETSRYQLQDVYNKNMALSAFDVAQATVMIPGVGKAFGHILGKMDITGKVLDKSVELIDNAIMWTNKKAGKYGFDIADAHKFSKYGIDPIVRLGATGLMEGLEETTQYMVGKQFEEDIQKGIRSYDDVSWYNPINLPKIIMNDAAALGEGVLALAGLHNNPALNNDEELANNFKVGAAIGFIMGGGHQLASAKNDASSYDLGRNTARFIATETAKAKDDVYKYIQYAEKAMGKRVSRDAFLDGVDQQIKNNEIPEGWTAEDLQKEKDNIRDIYDFVHYNNAVQGLPEEMRAAGAAILKHSYDRVARAEKEYNEIKNNPELSARIDEQTKQFMQDNGIDEKNLPLVRAYIENVTQESAIRDYQKTLKSFKEHPFITDPLSIDLAFTEILKGLREQRSDIKEQLRQEALVDKSLVYADGESKLDHTARLMGGVTDEIRDNTIHRILAGVSMKATREQLDQAKNKKGLRDLVDKYVSAVQHNEEMDRTIRESSEREEAEESVPLGDIRVEGESAVDPTPVEEAPETGIAAEQIGGAFNDIAEGLRDSMAGLRRDVAIEFANKPGVKAEIQRVKKLLRDRGDIATIDEIVDHILSETTDERTKDLVQILLEFDETRSIISDYWLEDEERTDEGGTTESVVQPERSTDDLSTLEQDDEIESGEAAPEELSEKDLQPFTPTSEEEAAREYSEQSSDEQAEEDEETTTPPSKFTPSEVATSRILDSDTSSEQLPQQEDFQEDELTLYYQNVDESMFPEYEPGSALNEYTSNPGNIEKLSFNAFIGDPDGKYSYDRNDRSTWDNAPIYVEVVSPEGRKFVTAIKTIDGAIQQARQNGIDLTPEQIGRLRKTRNDIIEAKLQDPDAKITFSEVRHTHGKLNVNRVDAVDEGGRSYKKAVYRPLTEVKGLRLPSDPHHYTDQSKNGGIVFGYGKGIKDHFLIVDKNKQPLPGHGGSGKIFIYPASSSTLDGKSRPIQLTEERFLDDEGNPNELAKSLAHAVIYQQSPIPGIPLNDILKVVLNYGKDTLLEQGDPRTFLLDKQFDVDYTTGYAQLGQDRIAIEDLRNLDGEDRVARFIANNLHWNTDKKILFGQLPRSFKTYLEMNNKESVTFFGSFTIDAEDVGLVMRDGQLEEDENHPNGIDGISYLIKHNKLKSDLNDQIYHSPFMYVRGVNISSKPSEEQQNLAAEAADPFGDILRHAVVQSGESTEFVESSEESNDYTEYGSDKFTEFFGHDAAGAWKMSREQVDESKRINTEKAEKHIHRMLGDVDVDIRNGVIKTLANGAKVYGVAKADCIVLSRKAEAGVEYHEAYHRVSLLMLDKEQRQKIYDEFKKSNSAYSKLSNKEIEELLADSFMDYMIQNEEPTWRFKIKQWFRQLKKYVGLMSNTTDYTLQSLFEAIRYGDFKNHKLDEESLAEFREKYRQGAFYKIGKNKDVELTNINTPYEYQNLLNSLVGVFVLANNVKYVSDIRNMSTVPVKAMINSMINRKKDLTEEQRNTLHEILSKFDTIMQDVVPIFESIGIRTIDKNAEEDKENFENSWDKAAYEYSKKDNALGSAKLFLHTLPEVYYAYREEEVNGQKVMVRSKKPIVRYDEKTGLPRVVDYDTAFSKVMKYLSGVETFAPTQPNESADRSLLGLCDKLGENDAFFKKLYNRLCSPDLDLVTETQLLQTIKSFNQNFEEISYNTEDGKTSFKISDSIHKRALKIYPSNWSDNFFNSSMIIKSQTSTEANVAEIKKVVEGFDKLSKEVEQNKDATTEALADKWLSDLVELFNKVGINIDKDTLAVMLGEDRPRSVVEMVLYSGNGAMKYFFQDTLNSLTKSVKERTRVVKGVSVVRQLDQAFTNLGQNSFITRLAEAEAQVHPIENQLSVLGANNNVIQTKTLNCFVSDQVRWLNLQDEKVMQDLKSDVMNEGSLILNHVKKGGKIKLHTFVNFYGNDKKDKGRDYISISPVEDYMAKMTFTWNNHIVFPTMADKKTWFTISGVTLFNEPLEFSETNNTLHRQYNTQLLFQMYKNWRAEFKAIRKYYETLANVKNPVENYHTSGKGGLFRHFDGYYQNTPEGEKWVDLNAQIEAAFKLDKKNGTGLQTVNQLLDQIEKNLFTDANQTIIKINNNLLKITNHELQTLIDNEMIVVENGKFKNRLLDDTVLNHYIDIYKASDKQKVRDKAEHYAILTMVGNHAANYQLGVMETEKIFTGDPAFYKNPDDQTKRLSAVLSTGDNLRTQWFAPSNEGRSEKELNDRKYLQSRQEYTCTVINDNLIVSAQHSKLEDLFHKYYIRELLKEQEGLSESEIDDLIEDEIKVNYSSIYNAARALATEDANAYGFNLKKKKGNINQADAAVYVSPQMYMDIARMLGEWSDEMEEAFKIMESDEDWLNDPKLYKKAMKALIKPLKTTYFCSKYDGNIEHSIPVFNKMAMFPLFKVLATGDLREVYDRMNAIGKYEGMQKIDQVAFESAVKVGIQGATDVYKDYTNEELNDLSNMVVTTQRFRNLRRQLITDPHTHDRTLFGTQVSTVAVSNLVLDRVYQQGTENEVTGEEIKNRMFGAINAISNKGTLKVRNIFLNPDGTLDWEKTSKQLIAEAHASNMGKDMEDALTLNETGDDFKIPLAALPDSKWIETKLISTTNKHAVDLELPGGAFIQMSSFGIRSIKTVSDKQYSVNGGKRLVNVREDGSMDAVISINLLKHIIPGYSKMSFMEARKWLIDHDIIGDGKNVQPAALGYRIPTQGLSSIAGIHIADVLPASVGDTIILPDEFTTQTGSDFDIDKLYIARYNYDNNGNIIPFVRPDEGLVGEQALYSIYDKSVKDKKKVRFEDWKKDKHNVYDANSREANENLLLRTYLNVLTDSKNVGETRLPLDKVTDIIKNEILPIVDGKGKLQKIIPMLDITPTYQMNKKYEYSGGKTGIGPFALNNKNHILTQLVGLKFIQNGLLKSLNFTGLDGIKKEGDSIRILDWLSAMINAHVDVAKDPYVIRLNVRQYTYNICNFLLRAGFGKNTFYFLPQPILKEFADAYDRAMGNYGVDAVTSKTQIVNKSIQKIIDKYYYWYKQVGGTNIEVDSDDIRYMSNKEGERSEEIPYSQYVNKILSEQNLIEMLQFSHEDMDSMSKEDQKKFYGNQLLFAKIFLELNSLSEDMSKLVQLSQIDTKRYGGNFVEQDRFIYRLKSLINNSVLFKGGDIMQYYMDTFLYTKLVNGILGPSKMFEHLMLRSQQDFKDYVTEVLMMTSRADNNDEALNKQISNELEAQIRLGFIPRNTNVFDMFYGPNALATRLSKIKSDILAGIYPDLRTQDGKITNGLLNRLNVLTSLSTDSYHTPTIITKSFSEEDKRQKVILKEYWRELLNYGTEDNEIRKFARDLVTYQLITTGGNFTKHGIFNLVPEEYLQESGYSEYMRREVEMFSHDRINLQDFFLNNWMNDKLVKPIELTQRVFQEGIETTIDKYPTFRINSTRHPEYNGLAIMFMPNLYPIGYNQFKQEVFTPYLKVRLKGDGNPANTLLYKFVGVSQRGNKTAPVYILVNKKGLNQNGRIIKEYDGFANSAFKFNNHPLAHSTSRDGQINSGEALESFLKKRAVITTDYDAKTGTYVQADFIKNFIPVQDFEPTTRALRMWFGEQMVRDEFAEQQVPAEQPVEQPDTKPIDEAVQKVEEQIVQEPKEHSFTFNDGFVIKTPFELNDQQKEALLELEKFVLNPEKYNGNVTLTGYAGTGKTTIISLFDKWLKHRGEKPVYSSPTHRANAVTKQNNPKARVYTLHKLFGLKPTVDLESANEYDLRVQKNQEANEGKIKYNDLIIIDESSMISEELYKFLTENKDLNDLRIIYVGDPAQLAPVKNNGKLSPVFVNAGIKQVQLTKVERTGDNPILEESTNIRNGADFAYQTKLINGEGVEYISNTSPRIKEIVQSVIDANTFVDDPLNFRILSATNDGVEKLNDTIHVMRFGKTARLIEPGELMMGYQNIDKYDPRLQQSVPVLRNSLDYLVQSVSDVQEISIKTSLGSVEGVKIQMIQAVPVWQSDDSSPFEMGVLVPDNTDDTYNALAALLGTFKSKIDSLWKQYKTSENKRKVLTEINMLNDELDQFKNSVLSMRKIRSRNGSVIFEKSIDYGYAHTIHKSQGGTYNEVMILGDTINTFKDKESKQQLRYVAMSRAKHKVTVVTNHELGDPNVVDNTDGYKTYTGKLTSLKPNQIFVFGSNTQGRHGMGAAATAKRLFGAKQFQAEGLQGQSYAIITKDLTKPTHPSRTADQIKEQIQKLYDYARQNPDKEFFIAYSGTGSNLNAYSNEEMAQFFAHTSIPSNIVFEKEFLKLIKAANTINIHYGNNENKDLSNFAERPFTIENFIFNADGTETLGNVEFRSVETAFHYTKLNYSNMDRVQKAKVANLILNAKTGAEAKNYGGRYWIKDFDKQLWDKEKFDIMKELIKESFKQNPDALQKLLATGNATLTHNPADAEWSTAFPRILMEVRDELRSTDVPSSNGDFSQIKEDSTKLLVNTLINSGNRLFTSTDEELDNRMKKLLEDRDFYSVEDKKVFTEHFFKLLNGLKQMGVPQMDYSSYSDIANVIRFFSRGISPTMIKTLMSFAKDFDIENRTEILPYFKVKQGNNEFYLDRIFEFGEEDRPMYDKKAKGYRVSTSELLAMQYVMDNINSFQNANDDYAILDAFNEILYDEVFVEDEMIDRLYVLFGDILQNKTEQQQKSSKSFTDEKINDINSNEHKNRCK